MIRDEAAGDEGAIAALVTAAFANAPHASGTEAAIVERLRRDGELAVSLVAEEDGATVGHVACSPVTIDGSPSDWFGLGPLAVLPAWQRRGIGGALVRAALDRLRARGAAGCVLLGDPAYYHRFGFVADPALRYDDAPARYFQRLALSDAPVPTGRVAFAAAFGA